MRAIYSFIAALPVVLAGSSHPPGLEVQPIVRMRWWLGPILVALLTTGCGSEERIYRLQGHVTYRGKPVPQGYIVFEPDSSHGNSGAAARSKIEDGKYDTLGTQGRGAIGGPHIIRIVGLNKKIAEAGSMDEESLPSPLFPPYSTSQELPKSDSLLDFDVPSN